MDNNYSLSNIILGLRREYKIVQEDLNKLKNQVIVDDKRVKDFYFRLFQTVGRENPALLCEFEIKRNKLQEKLYDFYNKCGWFNYGTTTGKVWRSIDGRYKILGNYHAQISSDKYFEEELEKVLQNEFVKTITHTSIYTEGDKVNGRLELDNDGICLYGTKKAQNSMDYMFSYYAYSDRLELLIFDEEMDISKRRELLENFLFEMEFVKKHFKDYERNAIEKSTDYKKDLIVDDSGDLGEQSIFSFQDKENAVVLKRVK